MLNIVHLYLNVSDMLKEKKYFIYVNLYLLQLYFIIIFIVDLFTHTHCLCKITISFYINRVRFVG